MALIQQNLADLRAAIGNENIVHIPDLETVETAVQNQDEEALSFKILYGNGRVQPTNSSTQKIWIYLTTHANPKRHHELRFVTDDEDEDSFPLTFDGEVVGRIVTERSPAFECVSKNEKIRSLAKYYFLGLMDRWNFQDDALKTPFILGVTLVDGLKLVCKDFEELARQKAQSKEPAGSMEPISINFLRNSGGRRWSSSVGIFKEDNEEHTDLSVTKDGKASRLARRGANIAKLKRGIAKVRSTRSGPSITCGSLSLASLEPPFQATAISSSTPALADPLPHPTTTSPTRSATLFLTPPPRVSSISPPSVSPNFLPVVPPTSSTNNSTTFPRAVPISPTTAVPPEVSTREAKVNTFNTICAMKFAFETKKRTISEQIDMRVKNMRQLQEELDSLDKEEAHLMGEIETAKIKKRELLASMSMSHEEQLDFVYEAARAADKQ
ncbi:hypothetical protein N0V90_002004 [Kalmusia sp. IMI 367209]|nr:hypothetical protein N0V90_002004 [Kalmusia sp. IMI 367209]